MSIVIHRFWHSSGRHLPEEALCGLKSFSPTIQMLWCYKRYTRSRIPGVVCQNAERLLPKDSFNKLRKKKIPIQLIKDIIEMRTLYSYGGWFIDLDYKWTGKSLPSTKFVFATMARKYRDAHTMGRPAITKAQEYGTLTLGCVKGPAGANLFRVAADAFLSRALSLTNTKRRNLYMKTYLQNSFEWEAMVLGSANMRRYIYPPSVFNPVPYWLKTHLPHSSWTYVVPKIEDMKRRSCTIVPWTRTWHSSLTREVEGMINVLRAARGLQPLQVRYKQLPLL